MYSICIGNCCEKAHELSQEYVVVVGMMGMMPVMRSSQV